MASGLFGPVRRLFMMEIFFFSSLEHLTIKGSSILISCLLSASKYPCFLLLSIDKFSEIDK